MNIVSFKPVAGPSVLAAGSSDKNGTQTQPCSEGGRNVAWITPGCWLRYDNVDFGTGSESIMFRAAAAAGTGGRIELHLDKADGQLLGTCDVTATGDWQKWRSFTAKIAKTEGHKNICLLFRTQADAVGDDAAPLVYPDIHAPVLEQRSDGFYLVITQDKAWREARKRQMITTEMLGKAVIPGQPFENPDGTPLRVDTDYFGNKRNENNPLPGPFETATADTQTA